MSIYEMLFLLLIFFVMVTATILTVRFLKLTMKEQYQNQQYFYERTISERNRTIQNLMDRLMSEDPRTYRILSNVTQTATPSDLTSDSGYVSMNDESEAARLHDMNPGLGDVIYDDETLNYAADMGIIVDAVNHRGSL